MSELRFDYISCCGYSYCKTSVSSRIRGGSFVDFLNLLFSGRLFIRFIEYLINYPRSLFLKVSSVAILLDPEDMALCCSSAVAPDIVLFDRSCSCWVSGFG